MFSRVLVLLVCFPFFINSFEVQNSLSDFLHTSREHYEQIVDDSQNVEIVHFVMGNESADLDSIASSISYAYFLNQEEEEGFYIPLINIHREEIALRRDVLYLFKLVGISVDDLLFLDDNIPLDKLFEQKRLRFNLVDHNVLRPRQKQYSEAVERVVDHHFDENINYPLVKNENKLIVSVGSNATLIAEKLFSGKTSPGVATFLLAPILIDTANLKSIERTTERDSNVAKKLEIFASSFLPHDFYQNLLAAKNDVSNLSPTMILSKDFKEYSDGDILYGISSIASSVQWNLDDLETVGEHIQKYALDRKLTYLMLLMSSSDPLAKRKVLVFSPSIDHLKAFDEYVRTDEVLKDILIPEIFSEKFRVCFYKTTKPIARKQLQPLLHLGTLLHTVQN